MDAPNNDWKPGQGAESPVEGWVSLNPSKASVLDNYKLLIGSIVPRPIAFISTISRSGIVNLAPFSFFTGVSSDPLCLAVSIAFKPDGGKKDTLVNIEDTGEFVVNSANQWLIQPLVYSAANFDSNVSELKETGLTTVESKKVRSPRIAEASIQFECKLRDSLQLGEGKAGSATLVIGEILQVHVDKRIYKDGKINFELLEPVSRLGGFDYGRTTERYSIKVPKV